MTNILDRRIHNQYFIEKLNSSELFKSLTYDPSLFFGVRNNYLNVYYMGASLAKINFVRNNLIFTVANKYCNINDSSKKLTKFNEDDFSKSFGAIKNEILNFQTQNNKLEKIAQQNLILNNNNSKTSKWFCIDMEYVQARSSREQQNHGRFDIIAVSINKPREIALIELKYGYSVYSGISSKNMNVLKELKKNIVDTDISAGSGIVGHVINSIRFWNESKKNDFSKIKADIKGIADSYKKLGLFCPIDGTDLSFLQNNPAYYIITVGENVLKSQKKMKKYLLNLKDSSKFNLEKLIGINIIEKNEFLDLHLLFSENDGSKIYDIISDTKFQYGL